MRPFEFGDRFEKEMIRDAEDTVPKVLGFGVVLLGVISLGLISLGLILLGLISLGVILVY